MILSLFLVFAGLSLVAVGGLTAIIPELHDQVVVTQGWMSDAAFAHLFALAQMAPGPNMLVVSLIGLHLAGFPGLLAATAGFVLPAGGLAVWASSLITRYQGTPILAAIKAGLVPVALGLYAAGGVVMCQVVDQDMVTLAFSALGMVFTLKLDRNPLWLLGLGAAVGAVMGG